jgi:hypothetical protein
MKKIVGWVELVVFAFVLHLPFTQGHTSGYIKSDIMNDTIISIKSTA